MLEKLYDLVMMRTGRKSAVNNNNAEPPTVTTGSIVAGALFRSIIIIVVLLFIFDYFHLDSQWIAGLIAVWGIAIFPAIKEYRSFNEKVEEIEAQTLCGSCKNFDPTSQLCKIFDEHVTLTYLPCEGQNWEPTASNFADSDK